MKTIIKQLIIIAVVAGLLTGLRLSEKIEADRYERLLYWLAFGVSAFTAIGYACGQSAVIGSLKSLLDVLYGARKLIIGVIGLLMAFIALMVGKLDGTQFISLGGFIVAAFLTSNVVAKRFTPAVARAENPASTVIAEKIEEVNQ